MNDCLSAVGETGPVLDPAPPPKRGRGRPRGSRNEKHGPRTALAFSRDEVEAIVRLRNHAHESAMAARAAAQVAFDASLALGSALRRFKAPLAPSKLALGAAPEVGQPYLHNRSAEEPNTAFSRDIDTMERI